MKRSLPILLLALPLMARADPPVYNDFEEPVKVEFKEGTYTLPPFPKDSNLVEFFVSAAMATKFYIDTTSISVGGTDQVVRYVMVVKGTGGARNVSYEGLRCDTNEFRLYATGTQEETWSKARSEDWRTFRRGAIQQKSLANLYFCPDFNPIKSADEGRDALRFGAHPLVKDRYTGR